MSERDDLAALIKDAYYHARDHGGTMHTAADDAADAILAAGWLGPAENERMVARALARRLSIVRAERDDLAATVQRVRALADEWERLAAGNEEARGKPTAVAGYYRRLAAQLRAALAASDPATEGGSDG